MFTKQGLTILVAVFGLSIWIGLQISGRHWAAGVFVFALPAAILVVVGQRVFRRSGHGAFAAEMKALRADVDALTRQIAAVEEKLAADEKTRVGVAEPRKDSKGG